MNYGLYTIDLLNDGLVPMLVAVLFNVLPYDVEVGVYFVVFIFDLNEVRLWVGVVLLTEELLGLLERVFEGERWVECGDKGL